MYSSNPSAMQMQQMLQLQQQYPVASQQEWQPQQQQIMHGAQHQQQMVVSSSQQYQQRQLQPQQQQIMRTSNQINGVHELQYQQLYYRQQQQQLLMDGDGYPASQIGTQLHFFTNQQQQIDQKQVKSQILFICLEARQWQRIVCDQYDGSFMYVRPGADPISPDLTEGIDVVHSQFIYGGDNSSTISECYNGLFTFHVLGTELGRRYLRHSYSSSIGTDLKQRQHDKQILQQRTNHSAVLQQLKQIIAEQKKNEHNKTDEPQQDRDSDTTSNSAKRQRLEHQPQQQEDESLSTAEQRRHELNAMQEVEKARFALEQSQQKLLEQKQLHEQQLANLSDLKQQKQQLDKPVHEIFASISMETSQAMDDSNNDKINQVANDTLSHLMSSISIGEEDALKVISVMFSKATNCQISHISDSINEERDVLVEKAKAEEKYVRLTAEAEAKKERYKSIVKAKEECGKVVQAIKATHRLAAGAKAKAEREERLARQLVQQQQLLVHQQQMAQHQQQLKEQQRRYQPPPVLAAEGQQQLLKRQELQQHKELPNFDQRHRGKPSPRSVEQPCHKETNSNVVIQSALINPFEDPNKYDDLGMAVDKEQRRLPQQLEKEEQQIQKQQKEERQQQLKQQRLQQQLEKEERQQQLKQQRLQQQQLEKEERQQQLQKQQIQKQQLLHTKLQTLQLHHQRRASESSFDMSNDKTEEINGTRRRRRFGNALVQPPITLQASILELRKMSSEKRAKIMKINAVLSSLESGITEQQGVKSKAVVEVRRSSKRSLPPIASISGASKQTGEELALQVLGAYGLNTETANVILRRTPRTNGTVQVKPYIRASPNWNDDALVASVFTQHISHRMAIPLYEELHSIQINEQDPYIAMDQSRHSGIGSEALAHLIFDIIESIKNDKCIILKVMVTEALRIDERREAVFPILDMLEALKVDRLILDSMGVNERTWVEIQTEQRTKNKEVGKGVSHCNAGMRVPLLLGDKDQRKTIFDKAKLIKAILVKGGADDELCQVVDKAEKDGATFYENNEPIIDQNNDLWLKSLEDRNNDVSAEEAVKIYNDGVKQNSGNLIGVSDIPRLIYYLRFSDGTDEDSKNQQSINLAAGFVLYGDSPTQPRMSIKDVHKSRAVSGHLGLATITTVMCMSEVERVTMMDPVRIGGRTEDREHQLENLKELARQTNTKLLFSRCHNQDDEVVNDMEGWRQRSRAANNDARKEKEDKVLPTDEQERKHHGWFASIKNQRLDMMI